MYLCSTVDGSLCFLQVFVVVVFLLWTMFEYSCRRQWQPTPVLLPEKSHGWRSLVGCSPCGREESDTTEQLPFHFSLSCIGERNGNPLQCSCLENPRDGRARWAAIYGVAQSQTWLTWLSSSSSSRNCWYIDVLLLDKPSRELPRWTNGKESTCQCKRHRFDPWVGKISWRRAWQPTPVFLPGESHGHRSPAGFSPQGPRVWQNWAMTTISGKACTDMSASKPRTFSITVDIRKLFFKVYLPASSLQALIISWCHMTFKILPIQWIYKDISLNPLKNMYICLFIGCAGSLLLLAGFSLVVASRGYSLVTVYGLLLAVASLVAEHRL